MIEKTWYPAHDTELRQLVAEGLSTYDIAERMGRTRFSIISRMPRIGVRSQLPVRETWTAEDDAQVASMLAKGFTARQIGEKLNITRNAVLGRMHRLKLKSGWVNQHTMGRNPATKEELAAKRRARQKRWRDSNPRLPTVRSAPSLSPEAAAKAAATRQRNADLRTKAQAISHGSIVCAGNPKHVFDLSFFDCRWVVTVDAPFSEMRHCGNPKEPGCSYCAAHQSMATDNRVKGTFVPLRGFTNSWRAA